MQVQIHEVRIADTVEIAGMQVQIHEVVDLPDGGQRITATVTEDLEPEEGESEVLSEEDVEDMEPEEDVNEASLFGDNETYVESGAELANMADVADVPDAWSDTDVHVHVQDSACTQDGAAAHEDSEPGRTPRRDPFWPWAPSQEQPAGSLCPRCSSVAGQIFAAAHEDSELHVTTRRRFRAYTQTPYRQQFGWSEATMDYWYKYERRARVNGTERSSKGPTHIF